MSIRFETSHPEQGVQALRAWLREADAVVIGAGAGLSAAAGFTYSGARFEQYFADFGKKYGFTDMYSGGFYPYKTPEEFWAYWSRYILVNRYTEAPRPLYEKLLELVRGKDYFVLTTNVDHCFQKAGFDKQRLFYTQGDYGLLQCSVPCCQKTYDNEALIRRMAAEQRDMRVPAQLVPRCPVCGAPMTTNLRVDDKFVEDEGWHAACARYEAFMNAHAQGKVLYLELGVGLNTPGIIKIPFWQMTAQNPEARYACLGLDPVAPPADIARRSLVLDTDLAVLAEL